MILANLDAALDAATGPALGRMRARLAFVALDLEAETVALDNAVRDWRADDTIRRIHRHFSEPAR